MVSWRTLGIVTPSLNDWRAFPTATSAEMFRLSFQAEARQLWEFIRIRQFFGENTVTQSTRIYPKEEKLIIQLPIPNELQEEGILGRFIECKKYPIRRGTIAGIDWTIELEELL